MASMFRSCALDGVLLVDVLDVMLLSVSRSSMQPAQVDVDATTLPLESCVELL